MVNKTWLDLWTDPPKEAAGWTRWWWFGCAVEKEEILYELDEIKKAGMGGVEIQILYAVQEEDPQKGNRPIPYFSPEFFEILAFTCEQAQLRELAVDFTLGSGWPYGGPMVPEDMSPETLVPYIQEIQGPCRFYYDYTCVLPGNMKCAVLVRKDGGHLSYESAVDVSDQFEPTYLYNWPWGSRIKEIDIPRGDWRLYVFIVSNYCQQVAIPARGMNGPVMDHCRKEALDLFFQSVAVPLLKRLGGNAFRAFFCDSIELGGNNFSSLILEEFPNRRGYDFRTALPAVWGDMGEDTPYLRYDYFKTFSELTLENFFRHLTGLSHEYGMKTRIQAHGTWADILMAYAAADIPEGETFGSHDKNRVNTVHRRLASSAAIVYKKPVVSNESFTWLRMPRFMVTPEMIKRAADAIFCDGMNHIINHGYAYSPRSEGRPGWAFYASSVISHVNPWWDYYPNIGRYIQRVSALMQTSAPVSYVAVYIPQADIWSDAPASELHMSLKVEQYVGEETVNVLQKAGYWFTYVNDDALTEMAELSEGGMKIGGNTYRAIVLSGCTRMPVDTARALLSFAQAGGLVITVGKIPEDSCGYLGHLEKRAMVRRMMEELFGSEEADGGCGKWRRTGRGYAAVSSGGTKNLTDLLRKRLTPDFDAGIHAEDIGFIHRTHMGADIYFISNMGTEYRSGTFIFAVSGNGIAVMDAVTGKEKAVQAVRAGGGQTTEISMKLAPNESCIVVFDDADRALKLAPKENWREFPVKCAWNLTIAERGITVKLDRLSTWETLEGLSDYSGEGVYRAYFTLEELPKGEIAVDFGTVECAARIELNHRAAGELWMSPYRLILSPDRFQVGENVLQVSVSGTLINEVLGKKASESDLAETVIDGWPYWGSIINGVRHRRVYGDSERRKFDGPLPIGMGGPVKFAVRL